MCAERLLWKISRAAFCGGDTNQMNQHTVAVVQAECTKAVWNVYGRSCRLTNLAESSSK